MQRLNLGLVEARLAALKFGEAKAAALRIAEFAEVVRDRLEVVDADVGRDVDGIAFEQIAQFGDGHRQALQVHDYVLAQVMATDAVIDRVIEPVVGAQDGSEAGFADSGHAEQGYGFMVHLLAAALVDTAKVGEVDFAQALHV